MVLTYISLVTNDVKHFFMCLLAIPVSVGEKYTIKSLNRVENIHFNVYISTAEGSDVEREAQHGLDVKSELWSQPPWLWMLTPTLTISVTWSKFFKGPMSLFHHLWNVDGKRVIVLLAISTSIKGYWHHEDSACLALNLALCHLG